LQLYKGVKTHARHRGKGERKGLEIIEDEENGSRRKRGRNRKGDCSFEGRYLNKEGTGFSV